jgi:predicted ATPase
LPEDRYEEWAQGRREKLRRNYLSLLLEQAGLYEERKEFGAAIEVLRRVVAEEPINEEAHGALMRLQALSGQHQAALGQYEQLRQALRQELGREPAEASRRLCEEIQAGQYPSAHPPQEGKEERSAEQPLDDGRHNLPTSWTSFIGREDELVEVKRLLAMSWLLTLTGAGGSGKTRLALEVARDLVQAYPDGAWLVELAGLSDAKLVPQEVANALGIREQPGRLIIDTLVDALSAKKLLLVLDNCEHLIGAAGQLAETLLKSCPSLRILATSREALGVAGETNWRVPSLYLPDPQSPLEVEELSSCESVRLFVERARHHNPAFVLTPQNAQGVAQICERLGGIPLAIELAAARAGVLSVEQIDQRLENSLKLLSTRSPAMPPRHRTLKATLDWSYGLLTATERTALRRLSVFADGFTEPAAAAVCALGCVAAFLSFRAVRGAGNYDAPPRGRTFFLAVIGMTVSPLLLAIVLMTGSGVVSLTPCSQS